MNDQNNYNQNANQYAPQQPQMNPNQYAQQPHMDPNQYAQQPQMNPNQYVSQQPQMNPNQYAQQPQMNPNQYAQQPQMDPNQYAQPQQMNPPQRQMPPVQSDKPEDDHLANMLCIISLVCMFVVPIGSYGVLYFLDGAKFSTKVLDALTSISTCLMGASYIAAWVLMILVRVKYKKNKFGFILMIIYLILLALTVIAIIFLIASCISCLNDCHGM